MNKLEKIHEIPYKLFWFDILDEISLALETQEIDLIGRINNDYKLAHLIDVTLTSPYMTGGVNWIKNENSGETLSPMYHYVSDNIPFYQTEELEMVWDIKEHWLKKTRMYLMFVTLISLLLLESL